MTRRALLLLAGTPCLRCLAQSRARICPSPDRKLRAIVTPVSAGNESTVAIRGENNAVLWEMSLQSADGEHGAAIIHAAWTPNSRFFAFSTEYSGGHSPLMHPIRFWDRKTGKTYNLDDFGAAVTEPRFYVYSPDVLTTTSIDCREPSNEAGVPLVVNLSELIQTSRLPASFACSDFKPSKP